MTYKVYLWFVKKKSPKQFFRIKDTKKKLGKDIEVN